MGLGNYSKVCKSGVGRTEKVVECLGKTVSRDEFLVRACMKKGEFGCVRVLRGLRTRSELVEVKG